MVETNQEKIREWLGAAAIRAINERRFNWDDALCAMCGHANNPVYVDYPHRDLYNHEFTRRPEDETHAALIQAEIDSLISTIVLWTVPPTVKPSITEPLQRGRSSRAL